jgi:hypothetical protein
MNLSNNKLDIKSPYRFYAGLGVEQILNQRNDDIKNTGYEYRDGVLPKTLSNLHFLEKKRENILALFDKILVKIIDDIKIIKKTYNYTFDQDYTKFN